MNLDLAEAVAQIRGYERGELRFIRLRGLYPKLPEHVGDGQGYSHSPSLRAAWRAATVDAS